MTLLSRRGMDILARELCLTFNQFWNNTYYFLIIVTIIFWNEVPYMRVAQGTYSTKSETLPLPWPALRYHSQRSLARPYAVGTLG